MKKRVGQIEKAVELIYISQKMPVSISVRYPDQNGDTVLPGDLDLLRSFEPLIVGQGTKIFCSTSNYTWERDLEPSIGRYFTLRKNWGSVEVASVNTEQNPPITPDEFESALRVRAMEITREEERAARESKEAQVQE